MHDCGNEEKFHTEKHSYNTHIYIHIYNVVLVFLRSLSCIILLETHSFTLLSQLYPDKQFIKVEFHPLHKHLRVNMIQAIVWKKSCLLLKKENIFKAK